MIYKIASPISGLFSGKDNADAIIGRSDCLECRDKYIKSSFPAEEVFHSDIQPIHEIGEEEMERLQWAAKNKPQLKLVTFHMASSYDKPKVSGYMFIPGGKQKTRKQLTDMAAINIARIRKIFNDAVEMGVENNNYYPNPAYEHVTDPDFISEIVRSNNIAFLLDLAHSKITCDNRQISYAEYMNALPLDQMIQIHISSPAKDMETGLEYDHHGMPSEEQLDEAVAFAGKSRLMKYFTIEYYRETAGLLDSIDSLRRKINAVS